MKIRAGFVSNSSSSSFLIYGVYLEEDEVRDHFGITGEKNCECCDYCKQEWDCECCDKCICADVYDDDDNGVYEKMEEITNGDFWGPSDSWDGYYIGRCPTGIRDDQTMGDWRKQVREEINAMTKKPIDEAKFGWHDECWYS